MYAIIDIETTGGSPKTEKITEIAIFIHDGNQITDEFVTLINPEKTIPYFITGLTGITNEMVANAPKFYEVAKKIVEFTEGKIFVAHNSNFDYSFIKEEFRQLGYVFEREQLCTVKLSRKLIPGLRSYGLGNLCHELRINNQSRHRAAGDALATVKLFEKLLSLNQCDEVLLAEVSGLSLKGIHPSLDIQKIKNAPEQCGVYYFYNDRRELIYVGKSRCIRKRLLSHFSNTKSKRAIEMKAGIADIGYEITGSELVALLLESNEIKKHKPLYNRSQRFSIFNYGLYTWMDENGYIQLGLRKNSEMDEIPVTTFNNLPEAKQVLNKMIEDYQLCQKLSGIYKAKGSCFHHQLSMCLGACVGKEQPDSYNQRVTKSLKKFQVEENNFLIIDKGRHGNEKVAIKVEKGKYLGFGYFDAQNAFSNIEELDDCINHYTDNRDVQHIIKSYLEKNRVEKLIEF
ncbi:MAG: GIY-YIG nuclease family protein [Bacteroidales bacterium]|nr:GIY-YIG nuclease family protein [Bacteroidales bacterium]